MNGTEALETIKSIELMHVEHEQDEDIDGEWVYTDHEVYDGTVGENYAQEIEVLEKEHKVLDLVKSSVIATPNIPIMEVLGKKFVNVSLAIPIDEFDFFKEEYYK